MKPTQEQLNDPKWWDEHSHGQDFIFFNNGIGEYQFANKYGRQYHGGVLLVDDEAWALLAKRPTKPAFVPEVGVDYILRSIGSQQLERKVKITYIGDGVGCYYNYDNRMEYTFSSRDTLFRPIKSERELFVEAVRELHKPHNWSIREVAEELYDSGLFCLKETVK